MSYSRLLSGVRSVRSAAYIFNPVVVPSIIKMPLVQYTVRMSSSSSTPEYDFVVYGASGFTGQYVVEEVARLAEAEKTKQGSQEASLSWAVAGRNRTKLLDAIEEARKETGLALTSVGIIEADVNDAASVDAMTSKAKVVINCVGPYARWGEQVVKSCIDNGADHVDISGEPEFLEGMQLKYDKAAEEKGVHVVGACGYDSVPAEMGMCQLDKQFPGGLNSVEMYGRHRQAGGRASVHTGTLESAVGAIANREQVKQQRRRLYTTRMPKPKYPAPKRSLIHHNPELNCYGIPFPTDEPMLYRTQRYRHDALQLRPIQFAQYLSTKSWLASFATSMGFLYFGLMCAFSWTRSLIIKYPEVFTAGIFTKAGADREALRKASFTMTIIGQGWSTALPESSTEHATPPDTTKTLQVIGPDAGYNATSIMMVASAATLLREKSNCERRGGVMTPGIAFPQTDIVKRMTDRGMKFDMV